MKKTFALFCALCLMPSFSAHAWVGGPFSNNSFFEPEGPDGVYEASATAINGIGIYRFVVGNQFPGVAPGSVTTSVPQPAQADPGAIIVNIPAISSGNVVIGGLGSPFSNIWFYRGVQYFGSTFGTANPVIGQVIGIASARNEFGQGVRELTSAFRANYVQYSRLIAATPFQGVGRAQTEDGDRFRFTVFGSKVSKDILFGL